MAHMTETPSPDSLYFMSNPPVYNYDYVNFVAHVSITQEPKSYEVAKKDSRWIEAMQAELDALEKNNT